MATIARAIITAPLPLYSGALPRVSKACVERVRPCVSRAGGGSISFLRNRGGNQVQARVEPDTPLLRHTYPRARGVPTCHLQRTLHMLSRIKHRLCIGVVAPT